jgi:predicted SnoaL-like aldol condensation-catalyzing enzyme
MNHIVIALAFTGLAMSVPGVGQSAIPERTAGEQSTLDRALEFGKNVFEPLKIESFKDYVAVKYVEHYPGMDGSLDALTTMFKGIKEHSPNGLPRAEPTLTMVDGDISLMLTSGQSAGGVQSIGMEIQRWKDGKQTEHWDGYSIDAPSSAPHAAARTASERHNLKFVLDFFGTVFKPLKTDQFPKYFAPDYIEHEAGIPKGGVSALIETIKKQFPKGLPTEKFVLTLVDGDLVALVLDKDQGPDPQDPQKRKRILGFDVLRIKNDKIVEHWSESTAAP